MNEGMIAPFKLKNLTALINVGIDYEWHGLFITTPGMWFLPFQKIKYRFALYLYTHISCGVCYLHFLEIICSHTCPERIRFYCCQREISTENDYLKYVPPIWVFFRTFSSRGCCFCEK